MTTFEKIMWIIPAVCIAISAYLHGHHRGYIAGFRAADPGSPENFMGESELDAAKRSSSPAPPPRK